MCSRKERNFLIAKHNLGNLRNNFGYIPHVNTLMNAAVGLKDEKAGIFKELIS